MRVRLILAASIGAMALAGCGGETKPEAADRAPVTNDPGPIHVHGLGVSRERVRQLEQAALAKLQSELAGVVSAGGDELADSA